MIRHLAILTIVLAIGTGTAFAADECARGSDKGAVSVYFDVGKTQVSPEGKDKLQRFAERAKNFRHVCVRGFADKQGDPSVNERISRERAKRVTDWLISFGVESQRIVTVAGGEPFAGRKMLGIAQDAPEDRRVTVSYGN
jgi:outer membrane protein OmpA-like peptidoglycan-associated protein